MVHSFSSASIDAPAADAHRWVIVLAGGSGTRLAAVTRTANGIVVPKQYCSLHGGRSLLADAIARAELLVPRERIVVVVAAEHEPFWSEQLRDLDPANVVVQPQNRGTAPGVLLPLLAVLQRDPTAQVTLLPSDHFVAEEEVLAGALLAAQDAAVTMRQHALLLGIAPDAPEGDYGWILPGPGSDPTRTVAAFVEKPGRERAVDLLHRGAVWNAFLLVADGRKLLDLFARRLRPLLTSFLSVNPQLSPARAAQLYQKLGTADFSRDLLQGSEADLALRVAPACGWTDLGTPERLHACATALQHTRVAAVAATAPSKQLILARRVAGQQQYAG